MRGTSYTQPSSAWQVVSVAYSHKMNELPSPRAGSARTDVIVGFYSGEKPDCRGRYIEEVWSFSDHQLENVHDYIQWLFRSSNEKRF